MEAEIGVTGSQEINGAVAELIACIRLPLGRGWIEVLQTGVLVNDVVNAQLGVVKVVDQHERRLAHGMGAQAEAGMRSLRRGITGEEVSDEGIDEIAFLGDEARSKRRNTLGQQGVQLLDERLGEANVSLMPTSAHRGVRWPRRSWRALR